MLAAGEREAHEANGDDSAASNMVAMQEEVRPAGFGRESTPPPHCHRHQDEGNPYLFIFNIIFTYMVWSLSLHVPGMCIC